MEAHERRLPLAVRRELLLSRAELERLELAQAVRDFRRARRPLQAAGELLAGRAGGGVGATLMGAISLLRRHPYLGSVASIAIGATRGSKLGRWIRTLGLLAVLVGAGAWFATRTAETGGQPPSPPDGP